MKKLSLLQIVVAAMFLSLLALPLQGHAQGQSINLKVANWFPADHRQNLMLESWCRDLEKRTNGRVKVNYYPAGMLVPAVRAYHDTTLGVSDVGHHLLGYTETRFPLTSVLDLPLGYSDNMVPTRLANAFYAKFKPKEFDDVKILWFHAHAPAVVHTKNKPVNRLEDLRGLKIITYGVVTKFMKSLGGTTVAMPAGEIYNALSRGDVDGVMTPYSTAYGFKYREIIGYTTENRATAYSGVFVVAMNKKKWNSLPPDIQKIIDSMSYEYMEKYTAMWDEMEKNSKASLVKGGTKVISLSKEEEARWVERAKPVFDDYLYRMKLLGLPGEEALKFVRSYLELHGK